MSARSLLARDDELAAALTTLTSAHGAALAVVGDAGIGKSVFLDAVAATAADAGFAVRRTQGAAAEIDLPLVGLHDLFADDLQTVAGRMSPVPREAVAATFLRTRAASGGTDSLALNLGVIELIELVSADRPLLVVLDDLQWIDRPTLDTLRFALRRVARARVPVVAAMRPDSATLGDLVPDPVHEQTLGALSLDGLADVVEQHTGAAVSRRLAESLHDLSEGNPLLALEIVRSSDPDRLALRELSVPQRYRAVLTPGIDALGAPARDALLAAALLSRPSTDEVTRVAPLDGLVEAETAGLVVLDRGWVRFSHPLVAAVCREVATPEERRRMHRRLAGAADDETERARHLGWSTRVPDEEIAALIENAATAAQDRAALATAADLELLAAELTPVRHLDERLSRFCSAATLAHDSGDIDRAFELARAALEESEPGPGRARCLKLLAAMTDAVDDCIDAVREALRQPDLDPSLTVELEIALANQTLNHGRMLDVLELTRSLEARATAAGRPELAALTRYMHTYCELMTGTRADRSETWDTVVADGPTAPLSYDHPDVLRSWEAFFRDDHDHAIELMAGLAERARVAGDLALHAELSIHLGEYDLRRGRLTEARTVLEESLRVLATGRDDQAPLSLLAHAAALQGDLDDARTLARDALATAERCSDRLFEAESRHVLGIVETSCGRYAEAADHLDRLATLLGDMSWGQPNVFPWYADAVETLLALDRPDDATAVADRIAVEAERVGFPTAGAQAARCRGLLLAHAGDLEAAATRLEAAYEVETSYGVRLEAARSLMALGTVRRRLRQKARARDELTRARDLFRDCGAAAWAARAERELERVVVTGAGDGLTSAERSVAELAAAGMTNREISGRVFISEKTVEAVLTRVYRKLAVRSRTELAHHPAVSEVEDAPGRS